MSRECEEPSVRIVGLYPGMDLVFIRAKVGENIQGVVCRAHCGRVWEGWREAGDGQGQRQCKEQWRMEREPRTIKGSVLGEFPRKTKMRTMMNLVMTNGKAMGSEA